MVEQPMEIGIDDLLARMPLEERVYRLRCVEAWSMTVPYSGFPMKALVDLARPLSSAKYVKMTTFQRSEEHKTELQSLMRSSYAGCSVKKKKRETKKKKT